MSHHSGPLLAPGTIVGGIWEAGERLGHGTFSEIFLGTHLVTKARCALKVDRPGPRLALQWESDVLRKLNKYPFAARHYGLYTTADGKLQVLAMQLLGNSISALRRKQPDSFMPYGSVLHIMLQMLACVEALHQEGYIHRDLKPSNFVHGLGRGGRKQVYVIDFGQSRMFADEEGRVRPARPLADFRGTSLYSSLHAHQLKDLGRRDDLWALWYIFMEMARGGLPWKCCKEDRYRCEIAKEFYMRHPEQLTAGLPGERRLLALHAHLQSLAFEATPDYAFVAECFKGALADAAAAGLLLQRTWPCYKECELFSMPFDESLYAHSGGHQVSATAGGAAAMGGAAAGASGRRSSASGAASGGAGSTGSPPRPLPTVLFWNSELSAACHPSSATLKLLRSLDATGESAELLELFNLDDVPHSSDGVLECRGGEPYAWEVDATGRPVYLALRALEDTELAPEGAAVLDNLRRERAGCQAVLEKPLPPAPAGLAPAAAASVLAASGLGPAAPGGGAAPSISIVSISSSGSGGGAAGAGGSGGSGGASIYEMVPADADDGGLSPSTGRKRRRDGADAAGGAAAGGAASVADAAASALAAMSAPLPSLEGKSDAAAANELRARVAALGTHILSTVAGAAASSPSGALDPAATARAILPYAGAWRRLAEAALARFEASAAGMDSIAGEVQALFKALQDATAFLPQSAASSGSSGSSGSSTPEATAAAAVASVLASSGGLLALPYATPADRTAQQLALARVEAWRKAHGRKPAPLAAVLPLSLSMSLMDTGAGAGAAGSSGGASSAGAGGLDAASLAAGGAPASQEALAAAYAAALERERGVRATAAERAAVLGTLLSALSRERELMRAPYAPPGWASRSGALPPAGYVPPGHASSGHGHGHGHGHAAAAATLAGTGAGGHLGTAASGGAGAGAVASGGASLPPPPAASSIGRNVSSSSGVYGAPSGASEAAAAVAGPSSGAAAGGGGSLLSSAIATLWPFGGKQASAASSNGGAASAPAPGAPAPAVPGAPVEPEPKAKRSRWDAPAAAGGPPGAAAVPAAGPGGAVPMAQDAPAASGSRGRGAEDDMDVA